MPHELAVDIVAEHNPEIGPKPDDLVIMGIETRAQLVQDIENRDVFGLLQTTFALTMGIKALVHTYPELFELDTSVSTRSRVYLKV